MWNKYLCLIMLTNVSIGATAQLSYPITRKVDTIDNYHGTQVADPYRWLEDDNSAETKAWVEAQNKVSFGYLEQIPFREQWKNRMLEVSNYAKYSAPGKKGEYYYYYKNDGLQNQSALYRTKGLKGKEELVLDPNRFSTDGTTRMANFSLSNDGKYAVVALSLGGSDWQTYLVRDMQTNEFLKDTISWVKVSGIAWQGDGFYYSRYPAPEKGKELSTKNENHQVFYHRIGTPQSSDELIYEDPANPQRFHTLETSKDERFSILTISDRGKGFIGNALWIRDSKSGSKNWIPLVKEVGNTNYDFIDNVGDRILVSTDDGAPNYRIIEMDLKNGTVSNTRTLIPEGKFPIRSTSTAGGSLFVNLLENVSSHVYQYDLNGKRIREIKLPGIGNASGFSTEKKGDEIFYTFSSYTYPPTIFQLDPVSGKSTVFRAPVIPGYQADLFETKQVFYTSKDGTRVPMFITHKKGLALTGNNPTILYGYGGFNISLTPSFSAVNLTWLEQGGIYVVANLRGGSEFGETWHKDGMLHKKQQVFDDFIAAAEHLIKDNYTSPAYLAIQGGSNGGLLVGAVINQRPELFKVAIPQVGVMDMLRYQKFTIGWNWIAEYGSSEKPDQFGFLYKYSPLHNISSDLNYPSTLITTADHDDRVVPAHSFKYAATLQSAYKGANPVIIRIDTKSGHGASNLTKSIELSADIFSFIYHEMGIRPKQISK